MSEVIDEGCTDTEALTLKQQMAIKANQILNNYDDNWGEINLIIPDNTLDEKETKFCEHSSIDELAHNFKQVIFDMCQRYNCLQHEDAHQAVNRLKEAVYWAKEFIENRESEV